VVSGPLGTGTFTLGASTTETNLTIFASAGPVEIDNNIFFDGDTNMTFAGVYNMLFTGGLNSGGVAKTISVTNGITTTFSGPITNTGSSSGGALTKTGGGILVFNGSNTYTGSTTVDAGTLLVNGSLSTNTVMVSGGTLGGKGAIAGSVTFGSGTQAYLYKTNGSPDSPLAVSGSLTLSNNTVIVDLGGMTTLSTGTYTLLTYAGALSGSFNSTPTFVDGSLAAGKTATIDLSTTNEVNLIVTTGSYTTPNFSPEGVSHLANGTISLSASGVTGTPYRLWASTNVALAPVTNTWTLITSNSISASPFTNLDLSATNFPRRFYIFTTP
jgi:autotransporter-associated beta strand protein